MNEGDSVHECGDDGGSINGRIERARARSPLAGQKITLLAASKGQPAPLITETIAAGITDFGENRVQDAQDRWPSIRQAYPDVCLHLIGPLQTNKVNQAMWLFDVIQTIDRPKVAEEIARSRNADTRCQKLFIQVNTGKEPQKAGVIPEEADALIDYCRKQLQLPIVGLMCIPPVSQTPAPHFALLGQIARRHDLPELSMGMSDDFETAIRMGSTCVRIGRALFAEGA